MRRTRGTQDIRGLASAAFASLAWMILGAGSIPAATIQIDGVIANGRPQWSVGGVQATSVAVNPGDTVIWRAVSGRHGVVFDSQGAAESMLQFENGGDRPPPGAQDFQGETVWGTAPQDPEGSGTVLARATVKSDVAPNTQLGFFCTQHGRMMSGTLAVGDVSPTPTPGDNPPTPERIPPVPGKQLPAPGSQPDTATGGHGPMSH